MDGEQCDTGQGGSKVLAKAADSDRPLERCSQLTIPLKPGRGSRRALVKCKYVFEYVNR